MKELDLVRHDINLVSIKDLQGDVNIINQKWNIFFNSLSDFNFIYFYGERCLDNIELIEETIHKKSARVIDCLSNNFFILLELNKWNFDFSRIALSVFWEYYEFPLFIFSKEPLNEDILKTEFRNKISFDNLLIEFPEILLIYRSFELDVLWIRKTSSLPSMKSLFPFFEN